MDSQFQFQMQHSPDVTLSLWQSVEDLICKIQHDQPNSGALGHEMRRRLHVAGEQRALEVLRRAERTTIRTTVDQFVNYYLNQSSAASPVRRTCMSSPSSPSSPPPQAATPRRATLVFSNQVNASTQSPVAEHRQTSRALDFDDCAGEQTVSPQLRALGELEFRRAFLILNYLGSKKLESIKADEIRDLKDLSMGHFESRVWELRGDGDRVKFSDWDSDKTHLYNCHVSLDRSCRFKGPYLEKTKNHLQKVLGDDNVLCVKFSEAESDKKMSLNDYWELYKNIAKDGITVGLRRYHFFVFKDGGKEEKKKDPTSAGVKCYFVRLEPNAQIDINQEYILSGKTVQEARRVFMHVHTLPNLARYMARLSLILSKTVKMEVDLDTVDIQEIEDIYCLDENDSVIMDKDGKGLILSDGTGFISEDLALLCPAIAYKGVSVRSEKGQPLMIQFRCFHKGYAYKGTVLLNRKLPPRTIQVRPSMIKVYPDSKLTNVCSASSFEIVTTSNQPKKTYLNRNLIALLSNGGVPDAFFLKLLDKSLEEMSSIISNPRSVVKAVQDEEFDNFAGLRMIVAGIPMEESYLQYKLSKIMNEESSNLRAGKLPIADSYYVMGTVDPTGVLESDEVCVILNEGPLSGKVLVYRNPGLHFGDVHIMTARCVEALHEYVGNAKYGIFFSSKGTRSVADEMAGGDYDGDMYFVSRNQELLKHYQKSEPWTSASTVSSETPPKRPEEFSPQDLEDELFKLFLKTRFQPSYTVGIAADSWLVIMDRFLGSGALNSEEKNQMKENMLRLIDLYYDALDAPKGGGAKEDVPEDLKPDVYPEHMGKQSKPSFKSNSILQKIHDRVKERFQEKLEKLSNIEVQILPCFDTTKIAFSTEDNDRFLSYAEKWENLYKSFRDDMSVALSGRGDPNEVTCKYCQHFDEKAEDAVIEALAIYNVVYKHARDTGDAVKCHFPWRVAGDVLCRYYIAQTQTSNTVIACAPSVLKGIL